MEKPRKKLFFDELEVERNPLKLYVKSISNNSREEKGKEIWEIIKYIATKRR